MSELPGAWVHAEFGQLFDFKGGSQPPKGTFSDHPRPGYVRLLQIRDFGSDAKAIFIEDSARWPKCSADDIMIGRYGASVGKILTGKSGAYNVALVRMLFDRELLDASWVRLLLLSNHFQDPLKRISRSAQNGFNKADLEEIDVPLAPLSEQRRIVAKIANLSANSNRVREHLDHIPRLVEKYKQAILAAAFRGELTREWRRLHPDVAGAKRLLVRIRDLQRTNWKEARRTPFVPLAPLSTGDEMFEIPPSWCWAAAEEIVEPGADIVYGIVQPGPKLASGVPYVRGTDIEDGQIKIDQLLFTSKEIAEKYSRASLQGGDILLGIIRATKVAVVPKSLAGANITQGTARFRPSSIIRTAFLARWLEGGIAQAWLHSKYRGIDMPGLNLRDVRRLPVPLAPLDEQDEVVRLTGTAFAWIERLASETSSARKLIDRLDQAILAKAFRGELVPQDPNDEPASVLLERIMAEREGQVATKRSKRARK